MTINQSMKILIKKLRKQIGKDIYVSVSYELDSYDDIDMSTFCKIWIGGNIQETFESNTFQDAEKNMNQYLRNLKKKITKKPIKIK